MECTSCLNLWDTETFIPRVLNCGHTICQDCCLYLLSKQEIICPICSYIVAFLERPDYDQRELVSSLPKNFSLLSVLTDKEFTRTGQRVGYRCGMKCTFHKLPIHSFSTKVFRLLCDECSDESEVLPIVKLVCGIRLKLGEMRENIQAKQERINDCKLQLRNARLNSREVCEQLERRYSEIGTHFNEELSLLKTALKAAVEQEKAKNTEHINAANDSSIERINTFKSLPDKGIIKEHREIQDLSQKLLHSQSAMELPLSEIAVTIDTETVKSCLPLLSRYLSLHIPPTLNNIWNCPNCTQNNLIGRIQCLHCTSFRPIQTYPNLSNSPSKFTCREFYELNKRRETENKAIETAQQSPHNSVYFLVSSKWIEQWKSFVFNKHPHTINSEPVRHQAVEILPPGPIENSLLLNPHELPNKLKAYVHYRCVNSKVWVLFQKWYGGGPEIRRTKPNLYYM